MKQESKSLELLIKKFEKEKGKSFEEVRNTLNLYLNENAKKEDLGILYNYYQKLSKATKINGKGKLLKEMGLLILKYGDGTCYLKKTTEDLMFILTNRSMQVKRYIALETLSSAPVYTGINYNNNPLTTSFIDYLCTAVRSPKENKHFKERSLEALLNLFPKLVAASRNSTKQRYNKEIKKAIKNIRETMQYVKDYPKRFSKKCISYATLLGY